jgi:predicted nucleotide-binding protein
MALLTQTSADDIRAVADYLKTKPAGEGIAKARTKVSPGLLDSRKVTTYRALGIVGSADTLKLDTRGREIARNPESTEPWLAILRECQDYRDLLDWIQQQGFETVPSSEVQAQVHATIEKKPEKTLASVVKTFFSICDAAGLGKSTAGRKGKETRLELNPGALTAFVSGLPMAADADGADDTSESDESESQTEGIGTGEDAAGKDTSDSNTRQDRQDSNVIFVGHSKNKGIRGAIERAVGLAGMEARIEVKRETTAVSMAGKVFDGMREASGAVINVSLDEAEIVEGCPPRINENVLTEIGGALALFGERVVLVWDKRLEVPSNLKGLFVTDYEGDALGAEETLDLLDALQKLRAKALPAG